MFENIINKTDKRDLEKIKKWVISVNSHNQYTDIDNLFYNSGDVLHLENKVRSKKVIVEGLKKTQVNENKETILLPLSSMVKVANKSIEDFISNLNESEKKELNLLLKEDETVLVEQFQNYPNRNGTHLEFMLGEVYKNKSC
jgi:predicted transcriptional regulator